MGTPVSSPGVLPSAGAVYPEEGIVMVLAPTGRDAEGTCLLLTKAGIPCQICPTFQTLSERMNDATGVLLVAEEAFRDESLHLLVEALEAQPVWSDLPLIVLTRPSTGHSMHSRSPLMRLSEVIGNIMFLERPLHAITLVSAVRSALKARQRQYQGRGYLIEREKAAEALLDYQKKLEESNRELEQFAMIASHDLQTPLRKVEMFASLMEKVLGHQLPEEATGYLTRMKKSIHHMQQLIADLLNLSRVTRQAKPHESVELSKIIQDAVDDVLEVHKDKGVGVELQNDTIPPIFGDGEQLRQVFQNLLENSLKFCRQDVPPQVKISTELINNDCCIKVQDNGIGFDERHADRIFETFQRLHGQSEYPGTGMGLAIVRKIIQRHNGEIKVNSTLGEGSTFVICLPVRSTI
jgi:signal transduction histidine kinase